MNDLTTDVLVIGAGLTGAMIAAHLADRNMRVGVVDAQRVGQAATRRALGLATLSPHPAHIRETKHGLERLKRLTAQHGALLQSCSVMHLATSPERQRALRQLAEAAPDAGLEWTTQADLLPAGFDGGLLVHDSALVDVDLLLVRLLRHPHIAVRQHAEVFRLESAGEVTYALCKDLTITAHCVVLATNVYVGLISPYLADSVRGARGAVWSSQPLHAGAPGHLYLGMPLLFDDARLALMPGKDGKLHGAAWLWRERDVDKDPSEELRRFLKRFGLGKPEQTSQWSTGVTTTTDDGAPRFGRLDVEGNVLYALGLGTYGLSWAPIVAERIAALAFAS
ncbi:MAG: FAD-dependent oxidoreductase [Anaerolineae bacterium]|nr:FAD-binding oxidoreductase [Candidatus Roseilinea sp.]MDW8451775.1 FAD-dependent oxidoreductase [Anaerolineae bacterium]